MEHKSFPSFVMKVDAPQGIVEHLVAVMGNKDLGDDVIWPGAFTKTLNERGRKVRVLDLHKTDSIMRVLGKPITLREIGAAELPADVKTQFPAASGALAATTQFNLKTPEGLGAFERIRAGDISEWSFGYDASGPDFGKGPDGKTVRNLREVRLYEYSPVIFGMNEATMTMGAKSNGDGGTPTEGKPWNVFQEGDKWRVYKLDADGKPTGDALGEFDTEEEARQQVEALYANEPAAADKATWSAATINDLPDSSFLYIDPDAATGKDDAGKTVPRSARHFPYKDADGAVDLPHLRNAIARIPQSDLSDALKTRLQDEARAILEKESGKSANKAGRRLKGDMVSMLAQMQDLINQMAKWANYQDDELPEDTAPAEEMQAAKNAGAEQAGPSEWTPTSNLLRLIEIEQEQLKLLEV